jgi:hypothetical protein
MFGLFKSTPRIREIFFHEDDYCQQQFLPAEATDSAVTELAAIDQFSEAHRAPEGVGWTDIYIRSGDHLGFGTLGIHRDTLDARLVVRLPYYDRVFTGYSSHREICQRTGAWGVGERCSVFADWDDSGIVQNIWTEFFDLSEDALLSAAWAAAAIAPDYPLIYIDWAWDYTCPAADTATFYDRLAAKLRDIKERAQHHIKADS